MPALGRKTGRKGIDWERTAQQGRQLLRQGSRFAGQAADHLVVDRRGGQQPEQIRAADSLNALIVAQRTPKALCR